MPKEYKKFCADYKKFKNSTDKRREFLIDWSDRIPCLRDATQETDFEPQYTYHPAWAARILAKTKPAKHIDISSTLHFCTMVSAFIPTEFYDYRPANLKLSNLNSLHADLLNLPFKSDSIESLSCMHVIEHIGLGRYGDPIDPIGDLKAIAELKRVLMKDGNLLFVIPIGKMARIQFNAHRIYTLDVIKGYFADMTLQEFALIPEDAISIGMIYDLNSIKTKLESQFLHVVVFGLKNNV